jgi:hypothetical protein
MEELEHLEDIYRQFKQQKIMHKSEELRLRGEIAATILACQVKGISNYKLAQVLKTDRTEISRLSGGLVGRRGATIPLTAAVLESAGLRLPSAVTAREAVRKHVQSTTEPEPLPVPREAIPCRYCSAKAMFVEIMPDGKAFFVCSRHNPDNAKKKG